MVRMNCRCFFSEDILVVRLNIAQNLYRAVKIWYNYSENKETHETKRNSLRDIFMKRLTRCNLCRHAKKELLQQQKRLIPYIGEVFI